MLFNDNLPILRHEILLLRQLGTKAIQLYRKNDLQSQLYRITIR